MSMYDVIKVIGELLAFGSLIVAGVVAVNTVFEGQRCLLRSEMLRIYYKRKESREIRQYELENFCLLYNAYKRLRGNSFIDKVNKDVQEWKVIQ